MSASAELVQVEPPVTSPAPAPEVVLRTRGLVRAFGKVRAVDGVELELRRGEIYGFLGRNGAGKTTTLRMLMGIIRPDAGEVELLGTSTRRTTVRQKQRLGYVSQEQVFYPWMTPRQLGRFVGEFYPTWQDAEFSRLLGLLDVPVDRKVAQLSGGTRMKLALALALAHRPAVLLLDEPTAGLDPVARRELLDLLVQRCREQGQTALFSSHLVSEVEQVADRVGIIQDGRLRYQGSLSELCASVRRVRALPHAVPEGVPPESLPPAPAFPPEGFTVIRREADAVILQAEPPRWDGAFAPEQVQMLTLEDIFLAYARKGGGA